MEFKKYISVVLVMLGQDYSGTHGLNEELGKHRGREGRKECLLCDAECENVSHVFWDCPGIRSAFMLELITVSMEKMLESYVMVSLIYVMLSSVVCLCVVVCKARNSVLANTNMGLVN